MKRDLVDIQNWGWEVLWGSGGFPEKKCARTPIVNTTKVYVLSVYSQATHKLENNGEGPSFRGQ